jgi:hypothetical protein
MVDEFTTIFFAPKEVNGGVVAKTPLTPDCHKEFLPRTYRLRGSKV